MSGCARVKVKKKKKSPSVFSCVLHQQVFSAFHFIQEKKKKRSSHGQNPQSSFIAGWNNHNNKMEFSKISNSFLSDQMDILYQGRCHVPPLKYN